MPEEFPDNSRRGKDRKDEPIKDIKPIAEVRASRRKPPLSRRLRDTFIPQDVGSVLAYVWFDVLVPAAKDMLVDAGSEALHRSFYGEGGRAGRRSSRYGGTGSTGTFVNYNRPSTPFYKRDEPRALSRRARANHNFDDILIEKRVIADEVIDRLFDIISQYEQVTVADLYKIVDIEPTPQDYKWGWTDLRGAGVTRIPDGRYLLDLPRPEPLD